jgi:hypothetical protein
VAISASGTVPHLRGYGMFEDIVTGTPLANHRTDERAQVPLVLQEKGQEFVVRIHGQAILQGLRLPGNTLFRSRF